MYLLNQAKTYGLITDADHQKLESIYNERCLYGHPYEQQPTPIAVVAAATNVVELVLSKPTRLRHGYLSQQIDHLVNHRSFLDDQEPSVRRFAGEIITKGDQSLYLWFLQTYWERVAPLWNNPANDVEKRRAVWMSVAILEQEYARVERDWDAIADLNKYPELLSETFSAVTIFPKISDHAKEIVVSNLIASSQTSAKHLLALESLDKRELLDNRQKEKFVSGLAQLHLLILAQSGISASYFADRIIKELKSHNWYRQNPAVEIIKNIGPEAVATLAPNMQFELGQNVLQAAEGSAGKAGEFLSELRREASAWPACFVEGIVSECFINERDEVRFKNEHVGDAIAALRCLPPDIRNRVVQQVASRITRGRLKGFIPPSDRNAAVAAIQTELTDQSTLANTMIDAINTREFLTLQQMANRERANSFPTQAP